MSMDPGTQQVGTEHTETGKETCKYVYGVVLIV